MGGLKGVCFLWRLATTNDQLVTDGYCATPDSIPDIEIEIDSGRPVHYAQVLPHFFGFISLVSSPQPLPPPCAPVLDLICDSALPSPTSIYRF